MVLGAWGDLAKKKTLPIIFSLYYHDLLLGNFVMVGFARSELFDEEFRNIILATLSCCLIDVPNTSLTPNISSTNFLLNHRLHQHLPLTTTATSTGPLVAYTPSKDAVIVAAFTVEKVHSRHTPF